MDDFLKKTAQGLKKDRAFELNYKGVENVAPGTGNSASSVGPKRRSLIVSFASQISPMSKRVTMIQALELEKHFNELYNLCPYGLETEPVKPKASPELVARLTHIELPEKTMKAVQTVTLVFGKPSNEVSDGAIYKHIADLEAEIADLRKIEPAHRPKKLEQRIDELGTEIMALVDLVDTRK